MVERRRLNSSKSMVSILTPIQRILRFAPPQLLPGEDAALYEELLASICAAVNPADGIDEILVGEVGWLQWDVLRWRRALLKLLSLKSCVKLEDFLGTTLDYDQYRDEVEEAIEEALEELPDQDRESAQSLAHQFAANEPQAIEKVHQLLDNVNEMLDRAQRQKGKQLAQAYARGQTKAVKQVVELVASEGMIMDDFTSMAVLENVSLDSSCLTVIERLERLITLAERRRNETMREIDRHRAVLGEALQQAIKQIEKSELRVSQGKSAA